MMTNELPQLPKGWEWTQLGAVCLDPQYGWTTSATAEGTLHLLRTTDITSGRVDWDDVPFCREEPPHKNKYLLKDGDIVISRAGSVGYSHLIKNPKQAVFASYLIRFRPQIDERYVAFFLQSPAYWQSISEQSLGIAIPNVNASKLKQIPIPISPLPEQQRIVTKIEELFSDLDAGVAALQKTKAQLKRYRRAVLKAAVEGRLTAEWRAVNAGKIEPASALLERIRAERAGGAHGRAPQRNAPMDAAELGELPEGWKWARIGEVVRIIDYRGRTPPYSADGIPHIRSSNIRNGKIVWEDLRYVSEKVYERYMTRGLPQKGDLLFTTEAPLGEVAFVPDKKFSVAQRVMILQPTPGLLQSDFLLYQVMSDRFQGRLRGKGTGTTVTGVSSRNFKPVELPIPPLAEQQQIVAEVERRLSVADEIEKTVDASLKQAERLRQSILKRAFAGKLVPQDPSDEPADMLLERLRAARMEGHAPGVSQRKRARQA